MKRSRTLLVFVTLLVLLGVLGGGISWVQTRMNHIRVSARLTESAPLENAPPVVAFTTVALGGFRGLLADLLWLRLTRLQDQGSYFEMVQLASWIVKLQPRFTGAAAFLGWNMSYNVSVAFTNFEDRWRWVKKGIELIRDEALLYNPGDPTLYKELAWIYFHKIAEYSDDANRYYKVQLAKEMDRVFGTYPPDWRRLAAAPLTEKELRRRLGNDYPAFRQFLKQHKWTFHDLETNFRQAGGFPKAVQKEIQRAPWRDTVRFCLRRRWLQLRYRLNPNEILKLQKKYGDLDWRLPEAHAIYWASLGLESADKNINIQCERVVFQSLNLAFKTGRLIYLKDINYLEMSPNISLVDAVNAAYLESLKKHPHDANTNSIKAGYENFLVDAVVILYTFGQKKKADAYLRRARKMFGKGNPKRYRKTLDQFALDELARNLPSMNYHQAQGTVQGYLMQACYSLALGQYDRATAFEAIAHKIWIRYMRFIAGTEVRRRLPPYPEMRRNAVRSALKAFPPSLAKRLRFELAQETAGNLAVPLKTLTAGQPQKKAKSP